MVWAYDYYACTYDADCGVSLSRMLRDVFTPMREGTDTHLGHCARCGVVHLAHDEKIGIIECPVCVLARAGKFGQRRVRTDKGDSGDAAAMHEFGAWPQARTGSPASGVAGGTGSS